VTESDRPLPTPPRSRFGRDSREEAGPASGMLSDRMALAAAEGRLEEFLQHEIPGGDHARNLAMMMMGMSGMMPMETPAGPPQAVSMHTQAPAASDAQTAISPEVPPEVLAAIQQGDVANLMGILRAEHAKRAGLGDAQQSPLAPTADHPAVPAPVLPTAQSTAGAGEGRAGIDAAIIDELIRISADNGVTVDWLMLRAVKLYVEEYRKTGRL
jgi:hypothetical protein